MPTNIAEGTKRRSSQDYARFLNVAEGSLAETGYLLIVSRDLGYLTTEAAKRVMSAIAAIARMLHALRTKVEQGAET